MTWNAKVVFVQMESVKVSYNKIITFWFSSNNYFLIYSKIVVCRNIDDCSSGERCVQNKCEIPCAGHSQCMSAQACINGVCALGCRSNKDCISNESCINAKCQSKT